MPSTIEIAAADHPIKSVTVFKSSKAEVVRTFVLELEAGQNKIRITGLPGTIDTDSIRVSGLGQARLFDVVCTTKASKEGSPDKDSPAEAVRLLEKKKADIEEEINMYTRKIYFLDNYANSLNGEHTKPAEIAQFLETFADHSQKSTGAISKLNEAVIEIDRQIAKESAKISLKKGWALGEVSVVIGADEKASVELKLTYIVGDTSWEPTYELHASTVNGKPSSAVSLHYRARVKQETGEDWSDAALTLSTVSSDTTTKNIPLLRSLKIRPRQPGGFGKGNAFFQDNRLQQQAQQQVQSHMQQPQVQQHQVNIRFGQQAPPPPPPPPGGGFAAFKNQPNNLFAAAQNQPTNVFGSSTTQPTSTGLFGSAPAQPTHTGFGGTSNFGFVQPAEADTHAEEDDDAFEDVVVAGPFSEPTTVVSESPLAIAYAVEGKCTIPSDGVAHQVSVAVLPFESKITHVTIPRIQPRVYLQCQVKNTSEYRLLPGLVTIILDDSYVSKTWISDINTGDMFDCTLGTDSATKVTYSRSSRTVKSASGSFAEVTNTSTYTSKITIHNKHAFAISDLVIRDVVPMSDDKRVKVILRKPEGLCDTKDGEVLDMKKDGLKVNWEKVVDGKGGEKEGKFEWRWKVDPGAQVKLEAEWEVKAPADIIWVESVA